MILFASAAIAQPIKIRAEHVSADSEMICAWNQVLAEGNGVSLNARYGCYDLELQQFRFHQAHLIHPLGTIYFSDGVYQINGQFWLNEAMVNDSIRFQAHQISATEEKLQLISPTVWPCDCAQWVIEADQAVMNEDWIWFSKPKLVTKYGVIPLPKRKLSVKGNAVKLPQVSWEEGPWIRQGFRGADGGEGWAEYRTILGPSIQYRQPVNMNELSFTPQLHLGFHEESETIRGSFALNEKDDKGWLKSGIRAQLVSDDAYLSEYGTTYLARQQAFIDQRLWIGASPIRLQLQQISLNPESLVAPTIVVEDSTIVGPVYGYGVMGVPLDDVEASFAAGRVGLGRDGRFVYGSAFVSGQYSDNHQDILPQVRLGGFGYAEHNQFRLLGRYGALINDEGVFAEMQQDLLKGRQAIGWFRARLDMEDHTQFQIEGSAFGRLPLYLGLSQERYWFVLNHSAVQPAVYWWEGTLAIVGQSQITVPNQRTTFRPSAIYFPQSNTWQSIGLGIHHRQPQHCLEEQFNVQWFPDRKWPVFRFQVAMTY